MTTTARSSESTYNTYIPPSASGVPTAGNLRELQQSSPAYKLQQEHAAAAKENTAKYQERLKKHMLDLCIDLSQLLPEARRVAFDLAWTSMRLFSYSNGPGLDGDPIKYWNGINDTKFNVKDLKDRVIEPAPIPEEGATPLVVLMCGNLERDRVGNSYINLANLPNKKTFHWHFINLTISNDGREYASLSLEDANKHFGVGNFTRPFDTYHITSSYNSKDKLWHVYLNWGEPKEDTRPRGAKGAKGGPRRDDKKDEPRKVAPGPPGPPARTMTYDEHMQLKEAKRWRPPTN